MEPGQLNKLFIRQVAHNSANVWPRGTWKIDQVGVGGVVAAHAKL